MDRPQKIVKRKLSDEVLDRLIEMIDSGQFLPGDKFPSERELMERFGVGRPSVREAMQSLRSAGLVSVQQGQRPKLTEPTANGIFSQIDMAAKHFLSRSPDSLEHLRDAWLLFSVGIVRRAAENVRKNDIARMQSALDVQERTCKSDPDKFVRADIAFHVAIAETTKNPIFVAMSRAMLGWLKQFKPKMNRFNGKEHITLDEHRRILKYIAAKDPDNAAIAMADHLNRTSERLK